MSKFPEQYLEEEEYRDKIRNSLPEGKVVEINNLFDNFEKILSAVLAPKIHSLFLSPVLTSLILTYFCCLNQCDVKRDFWFLLALFLAVYIVSFKLVCHFLTGLYKKRVNKLMESIAQDFKQNIDLWELLWLIRHKGNERDKEIATYLTQQLLQKLP